MRPIAEFLEAVFKGNGLVGVIVMGAIIFGAIAVYRAWNNRGGPPPNQ